MTSNTDTFNQKFHDEFIKRLVELRNEQNISARELSLALGQNVNYVNLIENGKRLPSLQGFFNICDFFHIEPAEFFKKKNSENTNAKQNLICAIHKLSNNQLEGILNLIKCFENN